MSGATVGYMLFGFAGFLLLISIMAAARSILLGRQSRGVPYVPSMLAFMGALLTHSWLPLLFIAAIDVGTVVVKARAQ